jgi:lipopolysaccharide export system permease protein
LFDPHDLSEREKSMPSLTLPELKQALTKKDLPDEDRIHLEIEYQRRWSLSLACMIFGILGVGLGTTTNRRLARASGFLMCLGVIVGYWVLYVAAENAATNHLAPAWLTLWGVNVIFFALGLFSLRRKEG